MSDVELRPAKHLTVSGRTCYLTPRHVIDALAPFDLDPCASAPRPWDTAAKHYTIVDDGLARPWKGLVWMNPPFGRQPNGTSEIDWWRKLAKHPDGGIGLTSPNKTETQLFQKVIFPNCSGILFLEKRLSFCNTDGTPLAGTFGPTCLVAFGKLAASRLSLCSLRGFYCTQIEQIPALF